MSATTTAPVRTHVDHDPLRDLELLIRSRYGLIVVDTPEEDRAETLLRLVADHLSMPFFLWSRSRGLRRDGATGPVYGTTDAMQALAHIASTHLDALFYLSGFESMLANEAIADRMREIATEYSGRAGAIVLTGSGLQLPEPLRRLSATVTLPPPDPDEYTRLLDGIVRDLRTRMNVRVELTEAATARLLANLRGLTLLEAEKVLTKAIVEDNRLTDADVAHVMQYKKEIVEREGVLEYYPAEESMAQVADLAGLKEWLRKRTHIITSPEKAVSFGLTFPKGVLLVGVPGCGKSLCAKAVAMEWGLPLLKLDPGRLYNKYIGESEKNFARAMATAERLAPCVLFIDELEKAFSSGDGEDGGVSQRVLGTFLSWLQDRKSEVFTVATANDVSRLPPEFLRKGRFDEVFFVDLPDADARRVILEIHLSKRGHDPTRFDASAITHAADGFSGAEIEQAIVSALYTAFADQSALTTAHLLHEIAKTRPLSIVMAERVHAVRAWAHGRTVRAN
ncbi:MAG: AAA family ATPase [Gemmatimonadetes bacterium]|nr:AAA family ATPase [Gemmatimonadota bacterium]